MSTLEAAAKWWESDTTDTRRAAHWRDVIGDHDWHRIGREVTDRLHEAFPGVAHFGDAVDFGCGGGAVSYALRDVACVYPVDIAERCIDETMRQCGLPPERRTRPGRVDLFVTASVIQHAPSEFVAENILRNAARMLRPLGRFLIQTRYTVEGDGYAPRWEKPYEWPHLARMTAWTVPETEARFATMGLGVERTWLEPQRRYLWLAGRLQPGAA